MLHDLQSGGVKRDPYIGFFNIYQPVSNKNHLTLERDLPAQIGALSQARTCVLDLPLSPGLSKLLVYNARLQGRSAALSTRVLPHKSDSTSENRVTCQLCKMVSQQGACPRPGGSWHASPRLSHSRYHPRAVLQGPPSLNMPK